MEIQHIDVTGDFDGSATPNDNNVAVDQTGNTNDTGETIQEPQEEAVCRVCHCEGEDSNPLYYPCKCDGSIKYVHQECLMQWLKIKHQHLGSAKCELCGEAFRFKLGGGGIIPRLEFTEFLKGLAGVIKRYVVVAAGVLFWAGIMPWNAGLQFNRVHNYLNERLVQEGYFRYDFPQERVDLTYWADFADNVLLPNISAWWNGVVFVCVILIIYIIISEVVDSLVAEYRTLRELVLIEQVARREIRLRELEQQLTALRQQVDTAAEVNNNLRNAIMNNMNNGAIDADLIHINAAPENTPINEVLRAINDAVGSNILESDANVLSQGVADSNMNSIIRMNQDNVTGHDTNDTDNVGAAVLLTSTAAEATNREVAINENSDPVISGTKVTVQAYPPSESLDGNIDSTDSTWRECASDVGDIPTDEDVYGIDDTLIESLLCDDESDILYTETAGSTCGQDASQASLEQFSLESTNISRASVTDSNPVLVSNSSPSESSQSTQGVAMDPSYAAQVMEEIVRDIIDAAIAVRPEEIQAAIVPAPAVPNPVEEIAAEQRPAVRHRVVVVNVPRNNGELNNALNDLVNRLPPNVVVVDQRRLPGGLNENQDQAPNNAGANANDNVNNLNNMAGNNNAADVNLVVTWKMLGIINAAVYFLEFVRYLGRYIFQYLVKNNAHDFKIALYQTLESYGDRLFEFNNYITWVPAKYVMDVDAMAGATIVSMEYVTGWLAVLAATVTVCSAYAVFMVGRDISVHVSMVKMLFQRVQGQATDITKWFRAGFIVAFEFVVYPHLFGWLVGMCTLRLFQTTMTRRVDQCMAMPVLCGIVHWIVGICFLSHSFLLMTIVVHSFKAELVHPTLRSYFTVFGENVDNVIQFYTNKSLAFHVQRHFLLLTMWLALVLCIVVVPLAVGNVIFPFMSPLALRFNHSGSEFQVSIEVMFVHVMLPLVADYVQSFGFKFVVDFVVRMYASLLNLDRIFAPPVADMPLGNGQMNAAREGGPLLGNARDAVMMAMQDLIDDVLAEIIVGGNNNDNVAVDDNVVGEVAMDDEEAADEDDDEDGINLEEDEAAEETDDLAFDAVDSARNLTEDTAHHQLHAKGTNLFPMPVEAVSSLDDRPPFGIAEGSSDGDETVDEGKQVDISNGAVGSRIDQAEHASEDTEDGETGQIGEEEIDTEEQDATDALAEPSEIDVQDIIQPTDVGATERHDTSASAGKLALFTLLCSLTMVLMYTAIYFLPLFAGRTLMGYFRFDFRVVCFADSLICG
jgi:hypothetical protein